MGKQLITQVGPGASPYRYISLTLLKNLTSGRTIKILKRWLRNSLALKEHESPKTSSILFFAFCFQNTSCLRAMAGIVPSAKGSNHWTGRKSAKLNALRPSSSSQNRDRSFRESSRHITTPHPWVVPNWIWHVLKSETIVFLGVPNMWPIPISQTVRQVNISELWEHLGMAISNGVTKQRQSCSCQVWLPEGGQYNPNHFPNPPRVCLWLTASGTIWELYTLGFDLNPICTGLPACWTSNIIIR